MPSDISLQASAYLAKSDVVMLRIMEAVCLGSLTLIDPSVVEWVNYRHSLRQLIGKESGELPIKPAFPTGT